MFWFRVCIRRGQRMLPKAEGIWTRACQANVPTRAAVAKRARIASTAVPTVGRPETKRQLLADANTRSAPANSRSGAGSAFEI
jgi:hypothetical protein